MGWARRWIIGKRCNGLQNLLDKVTQMPSACLGYMYAFGKGVEQDYGEASWWYQEAAEQGHAHAQYILSWMYSKGLGVEKNDDKSARWCKKAAKQGYAKAQFHYGWMLSHGKGVRRNWRKALWWYRKAAEQGVVKAQRIVDWYDGLYHRDDTPHHIQTA